jgi:hypothetical protein
MLSMFIPVDKPVFTKVVFVHITCTYGLTVLYMEYT